ncbi:UNVERIFIED_CONTAM: hypothetical protein FKN15_039731 [Acipenser sinensis]
MEIHIVPNYDKCSCCMWLYEAIVKHIQKMETVSRIIWPNDWVSSHNTIVRNCCTHGSISTTLSRHIDSGSLSNDISTPSSTFGQVEACLIHVDEFVVVDPCIQFHHSLNNKDNACDFAILQSQSNV